MFDRADAIDRAFIDHATKAVFPVPLSIPDYLDAYPSSEILVDLFDTQLMSRHLDLAARRSKGKTFYSIGSSGHEGMAALALVSKTTDMAFLHYRDAAFLIQRLKGQDGATPLNHMVHSFTASCEDPVSGGRHKVLGGAEIFVPPQTSTIASHLPKAVGAAHSIAISNKLKAGFNILPRDSVILASFGDASANHSTAQGAFNTASWAAFQGAPMPIVFICEDNDIGISVSTPSGWIKASFEHRPALKYFYCDMTNLPEALAVMYEAVRYTRVTRKPAFIHAKTVRLMGHAGADIEASYTPIAKIEECEREDPLLKTASLLIDRDILTGTQIIERYETMRTRAARALSRAIETPKLDSADKIKKPLIPSKENRIKTPPHPTVSVRNKALQSFKKQIEKPQPLARHINLALADIMVRHKNAAIFGEDVGLKGGVYSVTSGLQKAFGSARIFDTLLDEQSILGLAIGMGQNGFIPIPEIQFLAYLHNAEDQVRGEAATLPFFSDGQFTNPMVIRIAGLAYQKGFGGHFHNDNSFAVLRDIPGIIIACPSNGADGAAMLRECVRLAHAEKRVAVFLEPIALYNVVDLESEGDGQWSSLYQAPSKAASISMGDVGVYQYGKKKNHDLCIITYGNGYYLSRKAERQLRENHKINTKIIDLRWLHPLPEETLLKQIADCEHILIVDECRKTGSISEQIFTLLAENNNHKPLSRLTAEDCFIPLGPAAYELLPGVEKIIDAAVDVCGAENKPGSQRRLQLAKKTDKKKMAGRKATDRKTTDKKTTGRKTAGKKVVKKKVAQKNLVKKDLVKKKANKKKASETRPKKTVKKKIIKKVAPKKTVKKKALKKSATKKNTPQKNTPKKNAPRSKAIKKKTVKTVTGNKNTLKNTKQKTKTPASKKTRKTKGQSKARRGSKAIKGNPA